MGSKGSKKGYTRLKSWVQQRLAEEGRFREDAAREFLGDTDPGTWMRWLPRLFWESPEEDRENILRGLVPLAGNEATPFLEEVLASQRSGLAAKRLAVEQMDALGHSADPVLGEALQKAEAFAESLPEALQHVAGPDTVPEDILRRLRGLSPLFQGVVLRGLLRQPPENSFVFLERVLSEQDDLWGAVLEDLEGTPHEEAARLLQAGYRTADKALRKKIRRVHHRRSVRGLPVCPLDREAAAEAVWRPPVPATPEGLLSIPDPRGARMAWVIRPNVPKGMLVFGGWIDHQRGLMKFFVMDPSRRELEKYKQSLLTNPDFAVVECDPGFCASLLVEAYEKGAPLDPEEAEAFKAVRPMLKEVVPSDKPQAPIHAVWSDEPEVAVVGDPLGESANLLNELPLSAWAIEAATLEPHLDKLEAITQSRIIVHPMQKKERTEALFREIAGEILSDPARREDWRRRLEDTAWVFYKTDREGQARRLAQMSRYLADPEKDASHVSFFVELVRRGMEEKLEEKQTEEKQKPSLIVKPT
jgi:hypothetical protein